MVKVKANRIKSRIAAQTVVSSGTKLASIHDLIRFAPQL